MSDPSAPAGSTLPPREAFETASRLVLAALRAAQVTLTHLPFRETWTGGVSFEERNAALEAAIEAATAAVEPLTLWFQATLYFRGDEPFMGKVWDSAHEAAIAAASEAALAGLRMQGGHLGGPSVFGRLARDTRRELLVAVARYSAPQSGSLPPSRRLTFDNGSHAVLLDGKPIARNLPADAYHYVRLLAEAYPDGMSWAKMQDAHSFADSNHDRVKAAIPHSVERLIRRGRGKAPRLELPHGM